MSTPHRHHCLPTWQWMGSQVSTCVRAVRVQHSTQGPWVEWGETNEEEEEQEEGGGRERPTVLI